MQWYYAIGSERHGPVDTPSFRRLVETGVIKPDTLVWRAGMEKWGAWADVAPSVSHLIPPEVPPLTDEAEQLVNEVFDAWDKELTEAEAIAGAPEDLDMETLWERIRSRGYKTSVARCWSLGLDALKDNYWGALGVTLLAMAIMVFAQMIPFVGLLGSLLVTPQISAGLWWYFIRQARGETASLDDIFAGFRRCYGTLALITLFQWLLCLPFVALIFGGIAAGGGLSGTPADDLNVLVGVGGLAGLVCVLVLTYIFFRWMFATLVAIDRGYSATESLRLSWRIVGLRFWTLSWLLTVIALLWIGGFLLFVIGFLFVMPIVSSMLARAYIDAVDGESDGA